MKWNIDRKTYRLQSNTIRLRTLINDDESILATPKHDWEKTDDRSILEGPMFLEGPKDEVFIVYSAGA